jgi:hypothetical protein
MEADFIIGSDVWDSARYCVERAWVLIHPRASQAYPAHYHSAVRSTDLLIHPRVPLAGYLPGPQAIE